MTLKKLQAIEAMLSVAQSPEDVFGILTGNDEDKRRQLLSKWTRLTDFTDPGQYSGDTEASALAERVSLSLSAWLSKAQDKITDCSYGHSYRKR